MKYQPAPVYHRQLSSAELSVWNEMAASFDEKQRDVFPWTETGTTADGIAHRLSVLGLAERVDDSATGTYWRVKYRPLQV